MLWSDDGQPAVCVVDVNPVLAPDEVEIDLSDLVPLLQPRRKVSMADIAALDDLVSRCPGGGVSERAATGAPNTPRKANEK